ncbi:coiled-coil domain-containing protein, putative [Ixodes scapularis]|uniref:Coiled-coil domain-containing protein, putative n=1 Tax=Ixodes scapularis TaxID=6945 RepID=B7QHV5_IXOSC|nr:coiled-coil domain-containing protein, putative [Ixodes scapularis]|eukprot:XP_002414762.1 coiled-coil domain-containing protein, putative [Ixodes scapularis]
MDDDGLPIIGPGVDYSKVPPIQQKRTLAFLNYFLTRTTSFLNHFASVCDEKLEDLLIRIQRLEASMCILEAKLASIPGLENVKADPAETQRTATNQSAAPSKLAPTSANPEHAPDTQEPSATTPSATPLNTVSKDPRFSKYFKMLNVGIPLGAVQIKMRSEGVDPDILNNPDAPAPPRGDSSPCPADNSNSEDSSFSD